MSACEAADNHVFFRRQIALRAVLEDVSVVEWLDYSALLLSAAKNLLRVDLGDGDSLRIKFHLVLLIGNVFAQ